MSIADLRARGADPAAVVGALAVSAGQVGPTDRPRPADLVAGFSLARVGHEAVAVDAFTS